MKYYLIVLKMRKELIRALISAEWETNEVIGMRLVNQHL
jgi:hypothetical protein